MGAGWISTWAINASPRSVWSAVNQNGIISSSLSTAFRLFGVNLVITTQIRRKMGVCYICLFGTFSLLLTADSPQIVRIHLAPRLSLLFLRHRSRVVGRWREAGGAKRGEVT